ncbi:MAG TPA: hypothetical protein VF546_21945 [Pyrinomonadaceae bacterium]|jgi:uncharacterized small protein (DUF1192 family)
MEVIGKERLASVELFHVKVSEDELAVYEAALSHLLDTLDAAELEDRLGASRDEIEALRDDLRQALTSRETPALA